MTIVEKMYRYAVPVKVQRLGSIGQADVMPIAAIQLSRLSLLDFQIRHL